jgi:hypothetical protein
MGVKASNRLPRAFTGTEPAKYFLLKIVVKGEDEFIVIYRSFPTSEGVFVGGGGG